MAEEVKKEQAPKAAAPKQNKAPKAAKPQQNAKAEKGAKGAAKKAAADQVKPKGWVPNLEKLYKDEIIAKLTKQFGYKTVMQVPKLVRRSRSMRVLAMLLRIRKSWKRQQPS
jgi:hypothetical protein